MVTRVAVRPEAGAGLGIDGAEVRAATMSVHNAISVMSDNGRKIRGRKVRRGLRGTIASQVVPVDG